MHDRASSPANPQRCVCRDRASLRSNDRSDRSRLNARRARNSYGEASDRASCPDAFPSCRFAKGNSPGRKTPSVISSCSCRGLRDESGRGCSHLHGCTRARACGRCRGHVTGASHTRARTHTRGARDGGGNEEFAERGWLRSMLAGRHALDD